MSRKMFAAMVTSLGVLGAAMPTSAHHSFSTVFDGDQPVEVQGVITEIRLENPHSWFFVDVTDPDGTVAQWGFEGATPTSLIRSGFRPRELNVGDEVTIRGVRARDPSVNRGAARSITLMDGRSFIVGPQGSTAY